MDNDNYLVQRKKFIQMNLQHWQEVTKSLFGNQIPETKEWTDISKMVEVLNLVGKANLNHTFHPGSGGLDLQGCGPSKEPACLELYLIDPTCPSIVKPTKLTFNSFPGIPEWAYFLLETGKIHPSGVYPNLRPEYESESLTELPDGTYLSGYHWDENEYLGNPLPKGSRSVQRVFSGSFAIFQKSSPYNLFRTKGFNAYDAVHNSKTPEDFRKFCSEGAKALPSMVQND